MLDNMGMFQRPEYPEMPAEVTVDAATLVRWNLRQRAGQPLDQDQQRQGLAFGQWRAAFVKAEVDAGQNVELLMNAADALSQAERDADAARLREYIFQQYGIQRWEPDAIQKTASEAVRDYQTLPGWMRHGYEPRTI